jgi:uncharacterized iron-regulated membrane protein
MIESTNPTAHKVTSRKITVILHRYIGIVVGLILIVVGLTGSLLVFHTEIEQLMVTRKFGAVVPQEQRVPADQVLATAKTAIANRPELKISGLVPPKDAISPWQARAFGEPEGFAQAFINPYTGKLMGVLDEKSNIMHTVLKLHYALLAGDTGIKIAGIAGLLMFVLGVTGFMLWPGWKNLFSGFRIKWKAHSQRLNFDIHKVAGVVAATFLVFTGFTGFAWNFWEFSEPVIYAVTFSPKTKEPESKPVEGKNTFALSAILAKSDAALPGTVASWIGLPTAPTETFTIYRKQLQDTDDFSNAVYLDQYSGEVLKVKNAQQASLGDRVTDSFSPLHYGTFWGLPTRILYVFVGLSPLILLITGLTMYRYRKWGKAIRQETIAQAERTEVVKQ